MNHLTIHALVYLPTRPKHIFDEAHSAQTTLKTMYPTPYIWKHVVIQYSVRHTCNLKLIKTEAHLFVLPQGNTG